MNQDAEGHLQAQADWTAIELYRNLVKDKQGEKA